ncbi:Beta-lactamase related protein [Minicystis rosea]|nr:Beta-lactamase related protein [Minicystis rosea]
MAAPEIVTIDCDYIHPRFAAAYLRVQGDEAAFIETNTAVAAPQILAALDARGLRPEQVRWVIVTHVHLDHAGGAGAIMRACPNATLLAHPRAARHLIDPSKLVKSATQVYGADRFRALYGTIEPVPEARVRSLDDGARIDAGGSELAFFHVRGHANHHFVVHDPAASAVFTGDAFGLVYPALQRPGPFAFPSTSPTDFDAPEARKAIDRIAGLGTDRAFLTHFGEVRAIGPVAAQLHDWIDLSEAAMHEAAAGELTGAALEKSIEAKLWQAFDARIALSDEDRSMLKLDVELNAQGLAWAASKRREGKA